MLVEAGFKEREGQHEVVLVGKEKTVQKTGKDGSTAIECLDFILTPLVDRRKACCVYVSSPPLESPELDHNIVYARVGPKET